VDFWGNESHGCLAPNPVPRRFLPDRRPHAREIERLPRSRAPLRIAERERFLGKALLDGFGLAIQKVTKQFEATGNSSGARAIASCALVG
jgi:hypothetical protein